MSTTISATPSRRVVTEPAPHLRGRTTQTTEDASNTDLFKYDNANVKVYSFNVPRGFDRPGSAAGQHEAGTIPWKSRSDHLVTVGRLRLYRAPSEALMIGSGDGNWALPMMPGSKCWCVDNEASFAMKLRDKIYRIELPFGTYEEKATVEEFKTVLNEIIRYEKDSCPFKRGFDVETTLEDAGSPIARRRLIGTRRDQVKPYNLDGTRETRHPSSARTDGSPDISDDDLGDVTPPVDVHDTQQSDVPSVSANGVTLIDSPNLPIRPRVEGDKRSFAASLLSQSDTTPIVSSADMEPQTVNDGTSLEGTEVKLPEGADDHHELEDTSILKHDVPTVFPLASPEPTVEDLALDVIQNPKPIVGMVSSREAFSTELLDIPHSPHLQPEARSQLRSSSQSPDLFNGMQSSEPVEEALSSSMATEIVDSTPNPSTASSLPAGISSDRPTTPPPARRVSTSSGDALRMPGTPPTQPPAKSAATTRTSTITSSFRHSSISSDDDIPTLGLFSQTLNVLLGPPSGLMSVLIGFARRVGSYSRGAGSRGFGLSVSAGDWEGMSESQRHAGMPGSWDSEDERDSPTYSDVDQSRGTQETNGLKKTRSWASASETAIGQNGGAKSSGQRPELNREWTDDDLD